VTVAAIDSTGSVVTGYLGTIKFNSSDTIAALPTNYSFLATDKGTHTFTNGVTLKTAAPADTITATDTAVNTITGSATVAVSSSSLTQLKVTAPTSSAVGSAFSVTVSADDAYGNVVTGYADAVQLTSSDANAVLPAKYTFTTQDAGTHAFNVTLNTVGTGSQTITATDKTTASITAGTASVTVSSNVVSQLKVTVPTTSTAGSPFSATVSAENSTGQVVTGYTGTIHFISSDSRAVLPADYKFLASDNGTHIFNNGVTLKTTGTQSVTATDTVIATITGTGNLTVQAPTLVSIAVTPTGASISVGQTQQYTATGTFSDTSTQTLTSGVTWASSSTNIATINSSGLATGVAAGTTNITAAVGSITSPATAVTLQVTATTQGLVPRYLFEVNTDNSISSYAVSPSTGQLRAVSHFDNVTPFPIEGAVLNPVVSAFYLIQPNSTTGGNASVITYAFSAAGRIAVANSNFNGDLDGGPGSIAVDPLGRFLYGTDSVDNQISLYTLDAHSGAASFSGTAVKVSPAGKQLAIDPTGTFVYMEDSAGNIHSYQIGTGGTLTAVGTPPTQHPSMGGPIAVDPQNRYLVAVDNMSQPQVFAYQITNGTLTLVPSSPFDMGAGGAFISQIAIDPTGTYLYGIDVANNQLLGIFNNGGVFTPITGSPFASPNTQPKQLSVDPSGQYVYVAYENTQEVWTYGIASAGTVTPGGALSPTSKMRLRTSVSDSQMISAGTNPVTFTPQSFYVANSGTATIGQFGITPTSGALTSLGAPVAAGTAPYDVAADPNPSSPYLYAANQGSANISGYTIASNGTLSALSNSPFPAGNSPEWLAIDTVASGEHLYSATSGDGALGLFDISNGTLFGTGSGGGTTDQNPVHVSLDPNDLFAFTVNSPAAVTHGSIDYFVIGHSIHGTSVAAGNLPRFGAVHPSGEFFYVANNGDNTIFEYTINASTGAPTQFGSVSVPVTGTPNLSSIVIEPTGNYLYASDQTANKVYIFSVNRTTGALTAASTPSIATGNAPYAMAIDISGKYLYVSNLNSDDINIFSINLTNGSLTPVGTSTVPAGGTFPRGVTTTGIIQ
jgi:6-phosphogluconolactonase (cycloisomerase 2 family)